MGPGTLSLVLSAFLVFPVLTLVLILGTGYSESGAEARAACGLSEAGSLAKSALIYLPIISACLVVFLARFARMRPWMVASVALIANCALWLIFVAVNQPFSSGG